MTWARRRSLAALLLVVAGFGAACARRPRPVDADYRAVIESRRAERLRLLTTEDGWLTLVGLFWLEPGENRFGSAGDNRVVIASPGFPAHAGTFILAGDGSVRVRADTAAGLTCAGEPVVERALSSDSAGQPDVLECGRVRLYVIARAGRAAVRVKDLDSSIRTRFAGLEYFPVDPDLRVEARFEAFERPRMVSFPTAVGYEETDQAPGLLRFSLDGRELTLEPFAGDAGGLFIVFRDATSGEETYGAGRFLDTEPPHDGKVVLDFNLAYNPPCAFTPYATCPLPSPRNCLPVAIRAGEKCGASAH
jgi:uncharacterized protein